MTVPTAAVPGPAAQQTAATAPVLPGTGLRAAAYRGIAVPRAVTGMRGWGIRGWEQLQLAMRGSAVAARSRNSAQVMRAGSDSTWSVRRRPGNRQGLEDAVVSVRENREEA
ncbi:hypothetical protein GCM10023217_10220 [Gordonia alkaliphila]|uniref:Uncharacterized protein n=1 Tax=Gordonia alkaliphila TaxID=1053547 RepID=A0ABP8Z133_9ACTN